MIAVLNMGEKMGLLFKCHLWLSRVQLSVTPRTVAHQAPLPMEFSRQEYWNRLPFSSPGDLPDPGIEPVSLASPALAGGFLTTVPPGKPTVMVAVHQAFSQQSQGDPFVKSTLT